MLRTIFWLALVIAFIPVNEADLKADQRHVSTHETLGAAATLMRDVTGFCARNPATCDTGRELASQFGAKAKTGITFAKTQLDRHLGEDGGLGEVDETDQTLTGSVIEKIE